MRLLLLVLALVLAMPPAHAQNAVSATDWALYKGRFLDASGRVKDTANGGISHSEGQGYGLLLSYLAGARADFDLIWSFTRTELLLRDDGLAAWKWDPAASPHVTDTNNASDGDLLIAYALGLAGDEWQRPDLWDAGAGLAATLGRETVVERAGRLVMLPATQGFGASERADGPVVNLSYWVFEAFPMLARLAPDTDWARLNRDGMALATAARFGPLGLPVDWISLKDAPAPADGFPAEFGYNDLRVPLYLLRAGSRDRALLARFGAMRLPDGAARTVKLNGETADTLPAAGYRAIPALLACVLDGTPFPADLSRFTAADDYYPSTLHLLALSFAQRRHRECL